MFLLLLVFFEIKHLILYKKVLHINITSWTEAAEIFLIPTKAVDHLSSRTFCTSGRAPVSELAGQTALSVPAASSETWRLYRWPLEMTFTRLWSRRHWVCSFSLSCESRNWRPLVTQTSEVREGTFNVLTDVPHAALRSCWRFNLISADWIVCHRTPRCR